MLTQIDVDSENAFLVPIANATPKDSLLIRKITGLNPPDPNLFMGDYARDGGRYLGRRVGNRNVVLTIDLNPNPALGETVSGLREMLYKAFMDPLVDADYLKLTLHDDLGRARYLVGYTEKFDGEVFDIDTTLQISLLCPDPYIRDVAETVMENESGWTSVPFPYAGTAETGFQVSIFVLAATPTLTLNLNGKTMVITHPFNPGDVVEINTAKGSHKMTVTPPGGVPSSVLAGMSVYSRWLELHSTANTMTVYGTTPTDLIASIFLIKFTQAWWGV